MTPALPSTGARLLLLAVLLLLGGCGGEPDSGPGRIRWDRDVCEYCRMVISDPHFAAQVRGGPAGQKTRLHRFDDLGCALLWLDRQPWKDDPRTEIWVADHRDGHWIDARKAWYVPVPVTPMDFGLGAQDSPAPGALDFAAARRHIDAVVERKGGIAPHSELVREAPAERAP